MTVGREDHKDQRCRRRGWGSRRGPEAEMTLKDEDMKVKYPTLVLF